MFFPLSLASHSVTDMEDAGQPGIACTLPVPFPHPWPGRQQRPWGWHRDTRPQPPLQCGRQLHCLHPHLWPCCQRGPRCISSAMQTPSLLALHPSRQQHFLSSRLNDEGQMAVHQGLGILRAGQRGKGAEGQGQDGDKQVRKGQRDGSGRRVPSLAASLPPSLLCTQGLPALMCALRLLAAFPTHVSTPLWPISSIFITFCNAQSRVPNLKSALFPNVFVISTPRPSGCAFPNAELWLVGAARSPAPCSCYPEPCLPSCPAPGAQPWAQARDAWGVKRPGPISCFWPHAGICRAEIIEDKHLVALLCFTSCSAA